MSGVDLTVAIGMLGLAGTLLGVVITSTWRFSSLATKLTDTISQLQAKAKDLETKDEEIKGKYIILDKVPNLEFRIAQLETLHGNIPGILSRVAVLETQAQFSKELRQQSKPTL
jgi:hypothetical protein